MPIHGETVYRHMDESWHSLYYTHLPCHWEGVKHILLNAI
ncbi:hypothetical protein E2C01_037648 [Portunus trituberculatus]|uniref:Uncharacterized protein n=1 Tax=Portunus trituberculatus TaxID=210409 RepID=A0A5B7FFI3_PORTR|nr:hypothetical protein [Portunus trituberculatus]